MLKKNENVYDRIIRVIIAVVLFYVAYFRTTGAVQIVSYVIAAIALITGLTGYCYLYKLLKLSTLKNQEKVE